MSVSSNGNRVSAVTKDLLNQWRETREHWRDAKSMEFQRRYMEELFAGVDTTGTVIEQLDKLLKKIRNDCE
jgi:hypothetical protein